MLQIYSLATISVKLAVQCSKWFVLPTSRCYVMCARENYHGLPHNCNDSISLVVEKPLCYLFYTFMYPLYVASARNPNINKNKIIDKNILDIYKCVNIAFLCLYINLFDYKSFIKKSFHKDNPFFLL